MSATGLIVRPRTKRPRCGETTSRGPCARPTGHRGAHRSLTGPSQSPERVRERVRRGARKRAGLSITDKEELGLYAAQKGRCAICGDFKPLHGKGGLYVDHDHETRYVRAMVCPNCNKAMGFMGDDPARLRKAADYLERHRQAYLEKVTAS